MHCRSCELLLEEKFSGIKNVEKSDINYRRGTAEIYYNGSQPSIPELEKVIIDNGYEVGTEGKANWFSKKKKDYEELLWAILITLIGYEVLVFFGISDIGSLVNTSETSYGMVVLIGLVAGVSSCMALVGGLVLGLSAKHAEKHPEATASQKFTPHIYFNVGRIGGYAVLGGILGSLGSVFQMSSSVNSLLTLFAGAIMLFVGLQLIDIFPRLSNFTITLPKNLSKSLGLNKHQAEYSSTNSLAIGALTFFLPCGFTQAMQIYAVSTGSFTSGAIIMGLFALGTAPGLLSVGGLTSVLKGSAARKFFKVAGVAVLMFAFFNINNGLTLSGINTGLLKVKTSKTTVSSDPNVKLIDGVQVINMTESNSGYAPNNFTIVKGVPVKWIIDAQDPYSCASSLIAPKLGIRKNLKAGKNVIEFTPTISGLVPFSCSMGMYTGSFNIVESGNDKASSITDIKAGEAQTPNNSRTASCGVTPNNTPNNSASCGASGGGCGCGGSTNRPAQDTNTPPVVAEVTKEPITKEPLQTLKTTYTKNYYLRPSTFTVKAGTKTRLEIDVRDSGGGCGSEITIDGLYNNTTPLRAGVPIVMEFTPTTPGVYDITCGMGMIHFGSITVE